MIKLLISSSASVMLPRCVITVVIVLFIWCLYCKCCIEGNKKRCLKAEEARNSPATQIMLWYYI